MAAEEVLIGASTFSGEKVTDGLFNPLPTNLSYTKTEYTKFTPINSITASNVILYHLPATQGGMTYVANDLLWSIKCRITKADGMTEPDEGKMVGPINNVLHSVCDSVKVSLNNTVINSKSQLYNLSTYLVQTFSCDAETKSAQMGLEGYKIDTIDPDHPEFGPSDKNRGFCARRLKFMELKNDASGSWVYKKEATTFAGKLHTDLSYLSSPLPPGTSMKIEIQQSSDNFRLLWPALDTEKYKLIIDEASLYVKCAVYNEKLYSAIMEKWKKDDVRLHCRRIQVQYRTIARNSNNFIADNLFVGSSVPARLMCCIIRNVALLGMHTANPYYLGRRWTTGEHMRLNNDLTEEQSDEESVTEAATTGKRKTRKSGNKNNNQPRSFLHTTADFVRNLMGSRDEDLVSVYSMQSANVGDPSSECYIRALNLYCQGQKIDQLSEECTRTSASFDYFRLFEAGGFAGTPFTNSITEAMFLQGYYVKVFDLSCSADASVTNLVPAIRSGTYRLEIDFSSATNTELSLVTVEEYPSLIRISHSGNVSTSYLT